MLQRYTLSTQTSATKTNHAHPNNSIKQQIGTGKYIRIGDEQDGMSNGINSVMLHRYCNRFFCRMLFNVVLLPANNVPTMHIPFWEEFANNRKGSYVQYKDNQLKLYPDYQSEALHSTDCNAVITRKNWL